MTSASNIDKALEHLRARLATDGDAIGKDDIQQTMLLLIQLVDANREEMRELKKLWTTPATPERPPRLSPPAPVTQAVMDQNMANARVHLAMKRSGWEGTREEWLEWCRRNEHWPERMFRFAEKKSDPRQADLFGRDLSRGRAAARRRKAKKRKKTG